MSLTCAVHPHEGICLAKMGRIVDARSILQGLEQLRRAEYVDAYFMALSLDVLGRRHDAFLELERAIVESSSRPYSLDIDPQIPSKPRVGPRAGESCLVANSLNVAGVL